MATEALVMGGPTSLEPARVELAAAAAPTRQQLELGGVSIDCLDLPGAVDRLREFLRDGRSHQIVTVNLDFLSIAERNPGFRATLNQADMAVADGMPLVWLSRLKGEPLPERVAGVELVHECCRLATETGDGVFLLGAAPGVADAAAQRLQTLYPGLRVAGTYSPSYSQPSPKENQHILELIAASKCSFLFVALGAPRQDLWIREHLSQLNVPVSMGVGCVLDLLAGQANRAPNWMGRAGLEWAYRLLQEPQRLWRRYLVDDIPMLCRLITDVLLSQQAAVANVSPSLESAQ